MTEPVKHARTHQHREHAGAGMLLSANQRHRRLHWRIGDWRPGPGSADLNLCAGPTDIFCLRTPRRQLRMRGVCTTAHVDISICTHHTRTHSTQPHRRLSDRKGENEVGGVASRPIRRSGDHDPQGVLFHVGRPCPLRTTPPRWVRSHSAGSYLSRGGSSESSRLCCEGRCKDSTTWTSWKHELRVSCAAMEQRAAGLICVWYIPISRVRTPQIVHLVRVSMHSKEVCVSV